MDSLARGRFVAGWVGGRLGLLSTGLRHMATAIVVLLANTTGQDSEQEALSKYLTNVNKVR